MKKNLPRKKTISVVMTEDEVERIQRLTPGMSVQQVVRALALLGEERARDRLNEELRSLEVGGWKTGAAALARYRLEP